MINTDEDFRDYLTQEFSLEDTTIIRRMLELSDSVPMHTRIPLLTLDDQLEAIKKDLADVKKELLDLQKPVVAPKPAPQPAPAPTIPK